MSEYRATGKIRCGDRFRGDIGDLSELIESIRKNGLLHPIVVTEEGVLIAGKRRLEACRALGWTDIPVTIAHCRDLRSAEADENRVRLDLTPSEAVAVAAYFEEEEKKKAEARERAGKKEPRENFPRVEKGRTRDLLASRVGMSGRTLEKAKAVVEAAEKKPEKYAIVLQEMDKTGKVEPAYKELKRKRHMKQQPDYEGLAFLDGAKKSYLALNPKERKLFRKWLRTVD